MPLFKRFGLITALVIFVLWIAAWLWLSGSVHKAAYWAQQQLLEQSADLGFRVDNILLEGRTHTDAAVIKALINVERGDPLFAFDPEQARTLIEKIAWVRHAYVERRWPNTLYIRLQERIPSALWQKGKIRLVLDEFGVPITQDKGKTFSWLILFKGKEAPGKAPALLHLLEAEPTLAPLIRQAHLIENRRWNLVAKGLKGAITIKLPEKDVGFALRRLAHAQEEDGLLRRDIKILDLRESDRIIIRTRPGGLQEYRAGVKGEI